MKWGARRGEFRRLLGRINRLIGGTTMNKELLSQANFLMHDIETISKIVDESDCDMELCFARAHVKLKEWLSEFNGGY